MNRRRALAIAGTVTASVAGAALAFSANVGLLGFSRADTSALGELQADQPLSLTADDEATTTTTTATTALPPEIVVQYEDVIVQDPAAPAAPAPAAVTPVEQQPATDGADDEADDESDDETPTTTETTAPEIHDDDAATQAPSLSGDDDGVEHEDPVEIEHEGEEDDD